MHRLNSAAVGEALPPADPAAADPRPPRPVALALQGGGAWGAYTWGALDALLARRDLSIAAISGTSAGALNGAIVGSALAGGTPRHARDALESFWRSIAMHPSALLLRQWAGPVGQMLGRRFTDWIAAQGLSPLKTDPLDLNPLRKAIEQHVDIGAIRATRGPELFVTAVNVRSGLPRVFASREMSIEALMASACLPQLFHPVEIDGEHYWDGGLAGNPTLWPLVRLGRARDVILLPLTPDHHQTVPRDAKSIRRRMLEMAFNSPLVAEMQAIHSMREIARDGGHPLADARFHRIDPPRAELLADDDSATDRSWPALTALRDEGRAAAQRFLRRAGAAIGVESTLDIAQVYVGAHKPRVRTASSA